MNVLQRITLAGVLLGLTSAGLAQSQWDLPTPYATNNFQTEVVQRFADEVARATGRRLTLRLHPTGSLFKGNEIKQAVQSGQVNIGEILLSTAALENPIYGVDAVPFLATSYADARRLFSAARAVTEKQLAAQGLVLLYVSPWPPQGLYSNRPIRAVADFRGTKMHAFSPVTTRLANLLGASPVSMELAEVSQALTSGTVDSFWSSSVVGIESKFYRQTRYFYEINAWVPKNAVIVNRQAYDALDQATQAALITAGRNAETRGWSVSEERNRRALAQLRAAGVQVSRPRPDFQQELRDISRILTQEWVRATGDEGKVVLQAYEKE